MLTENLSTLKINRLTQEQYDAALTNGSINANELYLTPDDNELDTSAFLRVTDVGSAVDINPINADTLQGKSASYFATASNVSTINNSLNKINSNISSINGSLNTLDSDISTINGSLNTINSDISTINSSLNTINSDISTINSSLSAKAPLASPSFTGTAKVAEGTDYTTAKLRNITLSTADPSGGSNGDVWIKYTV